MTFCTLCNSSNTKPYIKNATSIYSDRQYDLTRCLECSNIFTDPQPPAEVLNAIYANAYQYKAHLAIDNEKKYRSRKLAEYIGSAIGKGRVVLEFGCMYGHLLEELNKRGHKCTGVELDSGAVASCNSRGISVIRSSVEDYVASDNKYDLIILSHVIEHFYEPASVLNKIKGMLSDDGKLLLIVPNSDSLTARIFGRFWGYWQVPVHLNHFNEQSLTTLLGANGFRVLRANSFGADSLCFMSTLANLLQLRGSNMNLTASKIFVLKLFSFFVRYWRAVGNEDLLIVVEKNAIPNTETH